MSARVLPAHEPAAIEEAAAVLRRGGLVAFPTETVYGLGADAFDPRAVARVFEVKARPSFDPLIVHLADAADLSRVSPALDPRVSALAAQFWPGPLTLVLPKQPCVPDVVTSGGATVALRAPAHPLARRLLRLARIPLAAPSANLFGYISPTEAAHVVDGLGRRIKHVLETSIDGIEVFGALVGHPLTVFHDPCRGIPGAPPKHDLYRRIIKLNDYIGKIPDPEKGVPLIVIVEFCIIGTKLPIPFGTAGHDPFRDVRR